MFFSSCAYILHVCGISFLLLITSLNRIENWSPFFLLLIQIQFIQCYFCTKPFIRVANSPFLGICGCLVSNSDKVTSPLQEILLVCCVNGKVWWCRSFLQFHLLQCNLLGYCCCFGDWEYFTLSLSDYLSGGFMQMLKH